MRLHDPSSILAIGGAYRSIPGFLMYIGQRQHESSCPILRILKKQRYKAQTTDKGEGGPDPSDPVSSNGLAKWKLTEGIRANSEGTPEPEIAEILHPELGAFCG